MRSVKCDLNFIYKKETHIKRVAAYCRVSTKHEEQMFSLKAQEEYYRTEISKNPLWKFVGIYSDKASGRSRKAREQFELMISDCYERKIDIILVKSISRFGRNTLDTIKERKVNMRGYLSKKIAIEILFIFPFAILPALLGYYGGLVALILIGLSFLLRENLEGSYKIYSDKKLLFNFIIVYSILLMNVFFTAFELYKNLGLNDEYVKNIIKIICLTLSLILLKISRVSIKNFKWNICRSHVLFYCSCLRACKLL